jgi:hypothetical protein
MQSNTWLYALLNFNETNARKTMSDGTIINIPDTVVKFVHLNLANNISIEEIDPFINHIIENNRNIIFSFAGKLLSNMNQNLTKIFNKRSYKINDEFNKNFILAWNPNVYNILALELICNTIPVYRITQKKNNKSIFMGQIDMNNQQDPQTSIYLKISEYATNIAQKHKQIFILCGNYKYDIENEQSSENNKNLLPLLTNSSCYKFNLLDGFICYFNKTIYNNFNIFVYHFNDDSAFVQNSVIAQICF